MFARRGLAVFAAAILVATSCHPRIERQAVEPARVGELPRDAKVLKVHMRDGRLYVLANWTATGGVVTGDGKLYDVNRRVRAEGRFDVPAEDIALLEANIERSGDVGRGFTVLTVLSLTVTAACALNPKACFGSCPTVYVAGQDGQRPLAEAFSASVAPSLEARDIDALYGAELSDGAVDLRVTNEAFETHVLRHVRLIAAPRPRGGRVLATRHGELWEARSLTPPDACAAAEGDCLAAVARFDGRERASLADEEDLAAREVIELTLPPHGDGDWGVAIGARQTFITTFLFYQLLAFAGTRAGEYIALIERADGTTRGRASELFDLLGGIEVQVVDDHGAWTTVGEFRETGPIATDVQLVKLPAWSNGAERVRLRLTRGHWRIDWIALASVGDRVEANPLDPVSARASDGDAPDALAALVDPARVLATMPGDAYVLHYEPPPCQHGCELLLDARGYYLEWLREEWLAEESPVALALMLWTPRAALRWLAPRYKAMEPDMERLFWSSRYAR